MATSRSLVLDTEDQTGKKSQKSFTSVNPDATINDMIGFAQLIVGLSNNTLKNSSYVEKTPLVAKSSRNITISTTISGITIDGLNVTIPSSAFKENLNWQVDLTVAGTGVGSATYSITPPALSPASNANIVGLYFGANSANEAILYVEAEDGTNQDLMLGEYKVLVHGDATYEDEFITITVTE